jgi:hypothetical protein
VPLIPALAKSLGCRALEDTLLYLVYVVALALVIAVLLVAIERAARFFRDHPRGSAKHESFSKGANR